MFSIRLIIVLNFPQYSVFLWFFFSLTVSQKQRAFTYALLPYWKKKLGKSIFLNELSWEMFWTLIVLYLRIKGTVYFCLDKFHLSAGFVFAQNDRWLYTVTEKRPVIPNFSPNGFDYSYCSVLSVVFCIALRLYNFPYCCPSLTIQENALG